ncbi:ATPase, T2SS/T4P/T4SS family [Gorillibacterium timonense]|uniref:ATPase, T2SS/T4P/T4SS family n=1 Tax=Gorillibacterium timonense TaxID=1689269 RepID=UPI00071D3E3A|nr:ATPase, T2SS/T4P/T4SS family [Gorillibacterium timonense]
MEPVGRQDRMKPRQLFRADAYLEDIKQQAVWSSSGRKRSDVPIGGRRMGLREAAVVVHEHLTGRAAKDSELHHDILQAGLGDPQARDSMKALIETLIMEYRIDVDPSTLIDGCSATDSIYAETCGASLIEDLLQLPDVEEVQVIGRDIFLLRNGEQFLHHRSFASLDDVRILQERLALCGKKPIHERQPVLQTYLWNRSRLVMTREPYTDVPSIHIRNFIVKDVSLDKLVELGTIDIPSAELLKQLVHYHASFLIGGSTNTGKTTFLYALAQETGEQERLRTLEKDFEISLRDRLRGKRNILAAREAEDVRLTMEEAYKPLLVMSPHWVILGEAKGAEVAQAVQGALRGHDVMATMHTKYRDSFLSDVEDMIRQDGRDHDHRDTQSRIARAFNIVVFLRLLRINGTNRRVVTEITELYVDECGEAKAKPLVEWCYSSQTWWRTGEAISHPLQQHLIANGATTSVLQNLGVMVHER